MVQKRIFRDLAANQFQGGNLVCVGLDSDISKVEKLLSSTGLKGAEAQLFFNKSIVEKTFKVAGFYKLNSAFYEEVEGGIEVMKQTVEFINNINPEIVVGCDAKRGDIGNTNTGYVRAIFDYCGFDFVTVAPYMGIGSLQPFLDREDKGVIVVCLTSNPEADEFEYLNTLDFDPADKPENVSVDDWYTAICNSVLPLYLRVADSVTNNWNKNNNCGLVVGANKAEKGKAVRKIAGDNMTILSPAVGKQTEGQSMDGVIEEALLSIGNSEYTNVLFNNSRAIIFSSNDPEQFAEVAGQKASEMHNTIVNVRAKLLTK